MLRKTVGDAVTAGELLAELHFNLPHAEALPAAVAMFSQAVELVPEPTTRPPLILERL